MLINILEVVLLLGVIIIPLRPQKKKIHKKIDSNTTNAAYAIAENGSLEKVRPVNADVHL